MSLFPQTSVAFRGIDPALEAALMVLCIPSSVYCMVKNQNWNLESRKQTNKKSPNQPNKQTIKNNNSSKTVPRQGYACTLLERVARQLPGTCCLREVPVHTEAVPAGGSSRVVPSLYLHGTLDCVRVPRFRE